MLGSGPPNRDQDLVALNADIVGYSRLLADDHASTSQALDRYQMLVRERVTDSGGKLVNFVGDNFMAVFEDSMAALKAAISISKAVEEANKNLPATRWVRFRMGIDKGEVTVSHDQFFGDALNIAARIQALARPGGVSVSRAVYQALDEPALRFRSVGTRHLKNIPEPVEIFEFAELPTDAQRDYDGRALSLEPPTVAVLPIHASGLTPELAGAATIIRSDLVHKLTGIPNLTLVDASEDLEAAPSARPQYILESGVHMVSDRMRVYVQLMEVATMNVIASHKWNVAPEDIFDLSETISQEVAFSIEVELIVGEPARDYAELEDAEGIQKIYQGWYHLTSMTPEGMTRALELFREVGDEHPEHPFGYALAALTLWMGGSEGVFPHPKKVFDEARRLATLATELGDRTELAHIVLAALMMEHGDAANALDVVESVEMNRPTCDVTFALAGSVRRYMGQWEQSVDLLDRAMRLTGVNKPWYPTVKACSLYIGKRNEAAASIAESVLEYQPRNLEALLVLAAAQVELGLERRARATAAIIKDRFPAVDVAAWLEARPYQDHDLVAGWRESLAKAGLVDSAA